MARMVKAFRPTQLQQPTLYGSTTHTRREQPLVTLGLQRNWRTRQTGSGEVTASSTYLEFPFTVLLVVQICSSYMSPMSLLNSWIFNNQTGVSWDSGQTGPATQWQVPLTQPMPLVV